VTVPDEVIKPDLTANSISYIFSRCRKGMDRFCQLFDHQPKLRRDLVSFAGSQRS
jgi:hypothetical protein